MPLDPDEQSVIYHKGFQAGQEHSVPSSDTKEFMKEQREINQVIRDALIRIEETAKNTLEQAKKTNGRVTKLEDEKIAFDIEYLGMLKEKKQEDTNDKQAVRGFILKFVAVGSLLALLGTNAKEIISLFK